MKRTLLVAFIGLIFISILLSSVCIAQEKKEKPSAKPIIKWGMTFNQICHEILDDRLHILGNCPEHDLRYGIDKLQYIDEDTLRETLGNRLKCCCSHAGSMGRMRYFFFLDDKLFGEDSPLPDINWEDPSAVLNFVKDLKTKLPEAKVSVEKIPSDFHNPYYSLTLDYSSDTLRLLIKGKTFWSYDPKVLNLLLDTVKTCLETQKSKEREAERELLNQR